MRGFNFFICRHHQYISQITYPRTTKMGMAKSSYQTIGIMISGTPVPASRAIVRTHTERVCSPRKCMSMIICPYKRIYPISQLFCLYLLGFASEPQKTTTQQLYNSFNHKRLPLLFHRKLM